jgi:3-oxoacyl-[acyl-carrier-protein] synthase-1
VSPLAVTSFTVTSALGPGNRVSLAALRERRSGLRANDLAGAPLETWIGRVEGLETLSLPEALQRYDCRNNRLALLALQQDGFEQAVAQARRRYGERRVAVLVGTSTSGIEATEQAFRGREPLTGALPASFHYRETHNVFSAGELVRRRLGLEGPASVVSTACSSSAKVFASAERLIAAGFADAAVVGGVDSLCLMTLYGFNSLQLLSRGPCRPCHEQRDGISIGEAAGFALLEPAARAGAPLALLGYGESSDAYHMSTPNPGGEGAAAAIMQALGRAGMEPGEVGYVNMHGTGTLANDKAEDAALHGVFGGAVPCSSTKGWTGHTLGAAGIVEAAFSLLCLQQGFIPGSLRLERPDPALRSRIAAAPEERRLDAVLSNSFGFGGTNCSLLFGRQP